MSLLYTQALRVRTSFGRFALSLFRRHQYHGLWSLTIRYAVALPPPPKKMHIYLHVIFHNVFARTHAMYGKCSQSFTSMLAVKALWIAWRRIAIGFHRTSLSKEKVLYLFDQVYGWLLLSSCFYRADDTYVHWAFQVLSSTDMMPNNTIFAVLPTLNGSKTTMLIGWVVCVCW